MSARGPYPETGRDCAPRPVGCQRAFGAPGDSKRPAPFPNHQRSPVVFTLLPAVLALVNALWQRGHTDSTSRRQGAVLPGSPLRAVKAKRAVGRRPQNVQGSTERC